MFSSKPISHEEYIRRKKRRKIIKYGVTIFLLVLIIGIASYISHRPELRIVRVELNGGILVTQPDVEVKALAYLQGSYFWLFPKNNAFWYPSGGLEDYLQESFKRIDTIDVHLRGLKTIVVDIKERKPFAIWCEGMPIGENISVKVNDTIQQQGRPSESAGSTEDTSPKCYFIDQNSTVFAKAPTFSGDAYFKYYGLISVPNGGSPIGLEYMASTTQFKEISDFVSEAKNLSIMPQYVVAKDDGGFSMILSGGGQIYFDMKEPLPTTGQNLSALLRLPVFASSTGNLPIDYIDLRYGNKLFYKLKQ